MFDVDGTMAETEEYHRRAFNEAFSHFDLPWNWDVATYGRLLRVAGGRERNSRIFAIRCPEMVSTFQTARSLNCTASRHSGMGTGGWRRVRTSARGRPPDPAGSRLANATGDRHDHVAGKYRCIVEPKSGTGLEAEFRGDRFRRRRAQQEAGTGCLSCGDLDALGLPAASCLAIEDSRNGLLAAAAAGVPVLITRSLYFRRRGFLRCS